MGVEATSCALTSLPHICCPLSPSLHQASACISLMGALVSSGSGVNGRPDPRQPPGSSSSSLEVVRAMREAGAVKALAQALKLINTQHPKVRAVRTPVAWAGVKRVSHRRSCQGHLHAGSPSMQPDTK
jgi:hypothetical protein